MDGMDGMDGQGSTHRSVPSEVLAELGQVVERVAAVPFDALGDREVEQLLEGLRVPVSRLEAVRARGFAVLERRAAHRAPAGGAAAAELEQRRRNAARQRMAPSKAKGVAEAGRAAVDHAAVGAAFGAGEVSAEHVRLIGSLLRRVPLEDREELEGLLVELAMQLDPVAFGRRARELLVRRQPAAAERVEQLAQERRSVRATDTADGGFAFSGLLYGTAAETARVALAAFRRPDTPGEHRTPEKRGADAFEQLCEAALRAGDAPTVHGVRPHVIIVIDEADLGRPGGVARLAHSGQPLPVSSIRPLLGDATISRLVRDAAGTPIEASAGVRTVPTGLWKALLARDAGCTWDGCDAPASWCDVAHGNQPFRDDGQLSPSNAALLCRRHHRRFDDGPYRLLIEGDRVRYQRQDRVPAATPVGERRDRAARTADSTTIALGPSMSTTRPADDVALHARIRTGSSDGESRPPGRGPERDVDPRTVGRRHRTGAARPDGRAEAVTLFDDRGGSWGGGPP
jgi:hypothetical protein